MKSLNKNTKLNERFRSSETVEKAALDENNFNYSCKLKFILITFLLS